MLNKLQLQLKNFKGEKSKWKVNIAATHKNANNERGRRTHPQAKEEEEGECFAADVNFMPNKVNERATSIYIPLLWYYYIKKKETELFLSPGASFSWSALEKSQMKEKYIKCKKKKYIFFLLKFYKEKKTKEIS